MSTWSYSTTSRFSATGTSCRQRPAVSSAISRAGIVPSSTNVDGSSQRWLKMRMRPRLAVHDRTSDQPAELRVVHRRVRAERDEEVERGHARPELALERLEHQRHRHRPRAVGDEDEHAPAVERESRKSLAREARDLLGREVAVGEAAADDGHAWTLPLMVGGPCILSRSFPG